MIVASIAGAISAAAVVSSARRLIRLGRLRPARREALDSAVQAGDRAGVARALDALFPSGWSPALSDALVSGQGSEAAVAELNEQLGDIDRELRGGEGVSKSASRIALFVGSFGAIVELLPTVGAESPNYAPAITAAGFGIIGAVVAGELGRRSRERVGDVRTEWDHIATLFARRFGRISSSPPKRPRRR